MSHCSGAVLTEGPSSSCVPALARCLHSEADLHSADRRSGFIVLEGAVLWLCQR